MEDITGVETIARMRKEKQALEQGLAMDLLEVFNDERAGLIQPLRSLVRNAVEEIDAKKSGDPAAFDRIWAKESPNYSACKDHGISAWNKTAVSSKVNGFRAEHCSDFIRLYGEVVENIVKGDVDMKRKSYQKGSSYQWDKTASGGRQRDPSSKNPAHNEYAARQGPAWEFLVGLGGGIKAWDIKDNDTTGKMDRVFGLVHGATISGTTTDTIFFLQAFGKANLDPVYYLLPLATIVGGGHHSLLEVATPLSLNGIVEYYIGLYSTLFPERGALPESGGVREVRLLLDSYQNHTWNNLILTYFKAAAVPEGCLLFDRTTEGKQWKAFSRANEQLLETFRTISPWPRRMEVRRIPFGGGATRP
jgi:hypothetical protein